MNRHFGSLLQQNPDFREQQTPESFDSVPRPRCSFRAGGVWLWWPAEHKGMGSVQWLKEAIRELFLLADFGCLRYSYGNCIFCKLNLCKET